MSEFTLKDALMRPLELLAALAASQEQCRMLADMAAEGVRLKEECEKLRNLYRAERSYAVHWDLNIRYTHDQQTEANLRAAAGGEGAK